MRRQGYHGYDVVVRTLSEHDFEADMATDLPKGALVRLRLPGAGMMVAHVIRSQRGRLCARFVNPVNPARLGKALGWMAATASTAA